MGAFMPEQSLRELLNRAHTHTHTPVKLERLLFWRSLSIPPSPSLHHEAIDNKKSLHSAFKDSVMVQAFG